MDKIANHTIWDDYAVIRTYRPFVRSRPGRHLLALTLAVVVIALLLSFSPVAGVFDFQPLPASYLGLSPAGVALYIINAEIAKRIFYNRVRL